MKKIYFLILIFSIPSLCFGENSQILKCRVANPEWKALFILDAVGQGILKFKRSRSPQEYICALKLDYIGDGQRAIIPQLRIEFNLTTCDPELGSLNSEILKKHILIIELLNKDKPKGLVQWLTKKQPDDCKIEKLSMFEIHLGAKKWADGHWGRSSADQNH